MRKLTSIEETALSILYREGSVLIGDDELQPAPRKLMRDIMDSLVKKKRATVEATDAGPRYFPVVGAL